MTSVAAGPLAGRAFLRPYLAQFDRAEIERALPHAVAFRVADPHVTPAERVAAQRLLD